MNASRNTLTASSRKKSGELPNGAIADRFDLHAGTGQAHRNFRGQSFIALRKRLWILEAHLDRN